MKRDPYELLGVSRDADANAVKKAFRRLARELHPDVNSDDPQAEAKFKEAGEAYEILSDPDRRATFDRYGHDGLSRSGQASSAQGFGSFSDIFETFFGGAGGDPFGGGRSGAAQGADTAVEVEIDLIDAATGVSVDVTYDLIARCERCHGNGAEPGTPIETCPRCGGSGQLQAVTRTAFGQLVRSQTCPTCEGDGRVAQDPCSRCSGRGRERSSRELSIDVPAGIDDGQRIRVSGRGHEGERGGPPGDLYVLVRVREDERFMRDGADLVTVVDVAAPDAALGIEVTVPTLDGEEELQVAAGTQPGTLLSLKGRGMPSLRGGRRGDQRVLINVIVPRNLSDRQIELLSEFRSTLSPENLGDAPEHVDEGIFARVRRALR